MLLATLCKGQNASSDVVAAKNLPGKWTLVKSTVVLKYSDGTVQNVAMAGKPGDYLEFILVKRSGHTAEGTFTSVALQHASAGKWVLTENKASLDFTYDNNGKTLFQFRHIDQLDGQLILSADDDMVKRIYETNQLGQGPGKKIAGGSIVEIYTR